jgi:hypothetical protein
MDDQAMQLIDSDATLRTLQGHFLATSTASMPVAGLIFWAAAALVGSQVPPATFAMVVLIGTGMVFPLGYLIDRLRGRNFMAAGRANPLTIMFMRSITMVALMFPLVIVAAREAGDPVLVVLGAAILSGIVWIPYGWAADDPVGLRHAIARSVLCYAAYLLAPAPIRGSAICAVVVLSYLYSLIFMRKPGSDAVD